MTRHLIAFILFPCYLMGQNQQSKPNGTYYGLWAETIWTYVFNTNNTFSFKSSGHFGYTNTVGQYSLSGDTIFLKSFPKTRQTDSNFIMLTDTLLTDGDSCIIDLSLGYDYCKLKHNNDIIYQSRQRIKSKGEMRNPK